MLQLTNINPLNLLSVKGHLSSLNIRPATLKNRFLLAISKLLTISSNCGLRHLSSKCTAISSVTEVSTRFQVKYVFVATSH